MPGKSGQRPQREFAVAGQCQPRFEGEIIARRMDVEARRRHQIGNRPLRQSQTVAFVVPQRLVIDQVEAQDRRQQNDHQRQQPYSVRYERLMPEPIRNQGDLYSVTQSPR